MGNMKPLENILKEVESLEVELFTNNMMDSPFLNYEYSTISGKARRKLEQIQDAVKVQNARSKLARIYKKSGFYSARYMAGKALRIDDEQLNEQLQVWADEMANILIYTAPNPNTRSRTYADVDRLYKILQKEANMPSDIRISIGKLSKTKEADVLAKELILMQPLNEKQLTMVYKSATDPEHRQLAVDRLGKELDLMRQLGEEQLTKVYESATDTKHRRLAGQKLGYSPSRIWVHEHPVTTAATVIAAAGAASGLVYTLVQYLSK